ncbi:UDP-glucuronosyltransferase 1-1 [Desmophyllum pertusum]|uniref:UDP-glucuronosyltransferase 1-1 n=1 Tax=Desmophyllum pertusum TaxID=174260 RepID=A0A9X0D7B1_9CNID|nr:UDP-glucuronosyltransferase 1-1 [Desmophyllum pertusum]
MLATAFGKLKQRVVWRLKGYIPSFLGANIKVMEWLPQNDLLAHKDIKAFVSHVGHNSLYESAYHGVPLVAFPLGSDQESNAKKVEHIGLALAVDYKSTNAQQLFETIERVISEARFKTKAMHISGLLKDRRRTPLQETCDWIEYVLRHGGARHLRAQVFNIPWYQYYLLDVMAFLVAIVTLVVTVIRMICRCMCRVCCKKGDSKTKKE